MRRSSRGMGFVALVTNVINGVNEAVVAFLPKQAVAAPAQTPPAAIDARVSDTAGVPSGAFDTSRFPATAERPYSPPRAVSSKLHIEQPAKGDDAVDSSWSFVADGAARDGWYLYPLVTSDSNPGRWIGPPLQPMGRGSWRGVATLGDHNTAPGTRYSVTVVQSEQKLPEGRVGQLPADVTFVSNTVHLVRRSK